ncbi:3D domain-containing protein [Mobilibacterium timonense]|uniref:3D domain-containing protein n=1 Tax=Mobilibacterium timonense TaxID=1871012 RepID=UPI000986CE89|nr:3D domain-containing protein [Mobilibacterium timonense]
MRRALSRIWHFNIWAYFTENVHRKVLGVMLILGTAALMTACIRYIIPSQVTVVYAAIGSDDKKDVVETRASDVAGAIKDAGIKVTDEDKVYPCREHSVKDGMTVKVTESIKTTAIIGGQEEDFNLTKGTVADNLKFNNIEYDDDDIITPSLDTEVDKDTKIQVQRVETQTKDVTETEPAGEDTVLDPSLASGKVVSSDGQDGQSIYTYTTTIVDGKETGTSKTLKEVVTPVTNKGLRLGTSLTGQSGSVKVVRTFTGNTTAYYAGENAHGSTGGLCKYGTCAVDPSVIPYGTKLYIEGYGFAVANDCGGAVKGNVVDLYMRSTAECISWGRRHVKVYVLE